MALPTRLWLFIYGYPNILGSILGLAGVALFLTGVIDKGWFLITAGLYALGATAAGVLLPDHAKGLVERVRRETLEEELTALVADTRKRLPVQAGEVLVRIQDYLRELLKGLKQGKPHLVEQAFHIEQTIRGYLPNTLESYLRLPPVYSRMHQVKDGKTAEVLLVEHLTLLEDGVKGLLKNMAEDDAQAMLANGRFLDAKFGKSESFSV